jgi:hypothetical protein
MAGQFLSRYFFNGFESIEWQYFEHTQELEKKTTMGQHIQEKVRVYFKERGCYNNENSWVRPETGGFEQCGKVLSA